MRAQRCHWLLLSGLHSQHDSPVRCARAAANSPETGVALLSGLWLYHCPAYWCILVRLTDACTP